MKEKFDFSSYIETRLLELQDLNQREYAKTVLKDAFCELVDYSDASLREILNMKEKETEQRGDFSITSGVVSIDEYDATSSCIFPLVPQDAKKREILLDEMKEHLLDKKGYYLFTIFCDAPYNIVNKLRLEKREFSCNVVTSEWKYKGTCYIKPRRDYEKICGDLYKTFLLNGVKFECPNIPYIYRFFNVYIKAAEFYDIDNITSVEIDFREYSSSIKYNMFPVWNIEKKVFFADIKPKPSEDMKQFLHIINGKRLKKDSSYLVAETNGEIFDVNYQEDLYITSSIRDKKRWTLYEFASQIDEEFEYRLFSNRIDKDIDIIRSQADVYFFVKNLNCEDFMILRNIEISETGVKAKQTYDMNRFIPNRLPEESERKQLCLYFEKKKENDNLTMDVLSYVITRVQEKCREYECIGLFI